METNCKQILESFELAIVLQSYRWETASDAVPPCMKQFSYQKYYFLYLPIDTMYLSLSDACLSFDNMYFIQWCVFVIS